MRNLNNRFRAPSMIKRFAHVIIATLCMTAVAETVEQDAYNMIFIEDQAFGKLIKRGKPVRAIARLEKRRTGYGGYFSVNTNLCVAHIMAKQPEHAKVYCDQAVASKTSNSSYITVPPIAKQDRAVALSNRGVLRALTGDYRGARNDFEKAAQLDDGLTQPVHNLIRLDAKLSDTHTATNVN